MKIYINHYVYHFDKCILLLFFFIINIKYTSNFFDLKTIGLKVKIQAPNEANFYELQWIALKLIDMYSLHKKSMLY